MILVAEHMQFVRHAGLDPVSSVLSPPLDRRPGHAFRRYTIQLDFRPSIRKRHVHVALLRRSLCLERRGKRAVALGV